MSHRYSHIKDFRDLDDELHLLSIRKQVILSEINDNIGQAKQSALAGFTILNSVISIIKSVAGIGVDTAEKGSIIARLAGAIAGVISAFAKRNG